MSIAIGVVSVLVIALIATVVVARGAISDREYYRRCASNYDEELGKSATECDVHQDTADRLYAALRERGLSHREIAEILTEEEG